jgi:hypothetical protein
MFIQKLFRNSTLLDAANEALKQNPSAVFIQADVQHNLFTPNTDVFVTVEIEDGRKGR